MVILGVLINETCYKTGRVSTRDFTVYTLLRFSNFLIIFVGISGIHVIPVIITGTLQGMFCDTGIPRTFYGVKICSVGTINV